jgi:hypothetical protein
MAGQQDVQEEHLPDNEQPNGPAAHTLASVVISLAIANM